MSIRKKALLSLLALGIVGAGFIYWRDPGLNHALHWKQIRAGNQLVAKVEAFRRDRGRLPKSLTEVGISETETGPLYYRRVDESTYVIWFGIGVGESLEYDPQQRIWK